MQSVDERNIAEDTSSSEEETEEMSISPALSTSPEELPLLPQDDSNLLRPEEDVPHFQPPAEVVPGQQPAQNEPDALPQPQNEPDALPQPQNEPDALPPWVNEPPALQLPAQNEPPALQPPAESGPDPQPPWLIEPQAGPSSGASLVNSPRWRDGVYNSQPSCSFWPVPPLQRRDERESQASIQRNPQLNSLLGDSSQSNRDSIVFDQMVAKSRTPSRTRASKLIEQSLFKRASKASFGNKKRIYDAVKYKLEDHLDGSTIVVNRSELAIILNEILWTMGMLLYRLRNKDIDWEEFVEGMIQMQISLNAESLRNRRMDDALELQQEMDDALELQQEMDDALEVQQEMDDALVLQPEMDSSLQQQQQQQQEKAVEEMNSSLQQQQQELDSSLQQQQEMDSSLQQQDMGTSLQQQIPNATTGARRRRSNSSEKIISHGKRRREEPKER